MIPISLHLQNFLSYGSDGIPLDFTQFDVACLSGANGQGKSALLDAITWALWGQARKSSHNRKPDADLLRIGTREMRVEFVFDIEGARYRVERLFAQSASGKTPKSGLELSIHDGADWRALTGTHQNETQQRLDGVLGVDYDTFVNASFLLQGRSDEFTRRRPEERKEVLARILDLSKYERLGEQAAEHERQARTLAERGEERIARLEAALAELPALELERAAVQAELEARLAERTATEQRVEALGREVAALRTRQEQAARLKEQIAQAVASLAALDGEIGKLDEQVRRAEATLAQRDAIVAEAARYDRLRDEQTRLQSLALQDRELEQRHTQVLGEIERRQARHREESGALETERKLLSDQIATLRRDVAQQSAVQAQLADAAAAAEQLTALNAQLVRRDRLRQQVETLRRDIDREKLGLEAERDSLLERLNEGRLGLPDEDVLDREERRLAAELDAIDVLRATQESIQAEGSEITAKITTLDERLRALSEAAAKVRGQQARVQDEHETECPTCGTRLTAEHRVRVMTDLNRELTALLGEQRALDGQRRGLEEDRAALRQVFQENREKLRGESELRAARTRVEEQRKVRAQRLDQLRQWNTRHLEVRRLLEGGGYAAEARRGLATAEAALTELDIDEAHVQTVRERAAALPSLRQAAARLEEAAATLQVRQARGAEVESALETLAREAADGTLLADLPEKSDALAHERAALGFSSQKLADVQHDLHALADVPRRRAELDSARDHHEAWKAQLQARQSARQQQHAAHEKLAEQHAALDGVDAACRDAEAQKAAAEAERLRADQAVAVAQQRQGGVEEKLRRVAEERAARDALKAEVEAAREQAMLYRHLRTAFSKKGIPSLIIEQTLPEIEERANRLLERLTEGRLSVRLESIRDKKTGGTAETLDIFISDEMGVTRAYETFSGGEAFRVNFALRIALSQLLAERSGIRIRTLVIDEGFGTQDAVGVQRLIEAINTVREDFDKILVVTHLDVLKNAFPTRIEVRKDPVTGSQYDIVTG